MTHVLLKPNETLTIINMDDASDCIIVENDENYGLTQFRQRIYSDDTEGRL